MGPQIVEKPRYRKQGANFYTDEKIVGLPTHGKLTASYILTGQVNRVGLFVFSVARAQEDLALSSKVFTPNFERILTVLGWRFDRAVRVLYIPTWWRYNSPENPNVLAGALEDLNGLPNTPLLKEFAANVRYLTPNLLETFRQRMGERFGERLAIQEQYQEQEQKQKQEGIPPSPPAGGTGEVPAQKGKVLVKDSDASDFVSAAWAISAWNALPRIQPWEGALGKTMRRRLKARQREHPDWGRVEWEHYFTRIAGSTITTGDTMWQPPLSWALEARNMEKILGGAYGDPEPLEG